MTATDHSQTRAAQRNRLAKATRVARVLLDGGWLPVQLVDSEPHAAERRRQVLAAAGVPRASAQSWALALELATARMLEVAPRLRCELCGSPVLRVWQDDQRFVDLDPWPVSGGHLVLVRSVGRPDRLEQMRAGSSRPDEAPGHRDHLRSCPKGLRAQRAASRERVRCHECQLPLHPRLAAAEPHHDTHPCCDTEALTR